MRPHSPRRGWEDSTLNDTAPPHVWVSYVGGSGAVEAAGTRSTIDATVVDVLWAAARDTSPLPRAGRGWRRRRMCRGLRVMRCPGAGV